MESTKLSAMIESIAAQKGLHISEVAKTAGMIPANLYKILGRETMSLKTFKKVMKAMGETVTIVLKNGNKFKIE